MENNKIALFEYKGKTVYVNEKELHENMLYNTDYLTAEEFKRDLIDATDEDKNELFHDFKEVFNIKYEIK